MKQLFFIIILCFAYGFCTTDSCTFFCVTDSCTFKGVIEDSLIMFECGDDVVLIGKEVYSTAIISPRGDSLYIISVAEYDSTHDCTEIHEKIIDSIGIRYENRRRISGLDTSVIIHK